MAENSFPKDRFDKLRGDVTTPPGLTLLDRLRGCRICEEKIPEPRPVFRLKPTARILVAGQAPGTRVHASGVPFTDPSGVRLRAWMGVTQDEFYDDARVAILPMGFCFPGLDAKGGDRPPPAICAKTWRAPLMELLPGLRLTLMIRGPAIRWHAPDLWTGRVSDAVARWRDAGEDRAPLPHPSWRNNAWLKKHLWFEEEVLPDLRRRIRSVLDGG